MAEAPILSRLSKVSGSIPAGKDEEKDNLSWENVDKFPPNYFSPPSVLPPRAGDPSIHNHYATKIVRGGKIGCCALVQCRHPSYIQIGALRFSTGETYSPGP